MKPARQTLATAFTLLALTALPGHAQQLMGTITGSAMDSSGSILQGASVKATDNGTGLVRSTQTGEDGKFRFLLLPVGNYRIEASQAGFKGFRRDGIIVEADRSLDVTIALEVGSVVEVVEVTAGTPLLEPNTSSLGSVIDKQKVDDLPLNGRNPMGLANLIPTVRGIGFFGGQVLSSWRMAAVSIGGGSALHNDFMVDGIATTKVGSSGAQVYPTIESTQEFKILTNAMSAEFGRTAGGVVSVITRSGTNEYHGNLFEYLRNDKLNANEFFSNKAGRQRPTLRWNQFGGSLGGPIVRNRLFFFANYETFMERRVAQQIQTSATRLQRAGDFSETRNQAGALITIYDPFTTQANPNAPGTFVRTPFPGNRIPAGRISPIAQKAMSFYPEPNLPGLPITQAQNLFLQAGGPIDRHTMTGKVDFNISASRRINGRYTWDDLNWQFPRFYGTPAEPDGRTVLIPRNSVSTNYTDTLTPTLLLDVKLGFSRENENYVLPSQGFDITTLGFSEALRAQTSVAMGARFPTFSVGDMATLSGQSSAGSPSVTTLASANLTKVFRSHTVKFGGEQRFYGINPWGRGSSSGSYTFNRGFTQGPNPLVVSPSAGFGVASFLLGTPASGTATLAPDRTQSLRYYSSFIQDDWKVTSRLTLNLGLRWEYESPLTDRYNILSVFDPDANVSLSPTQQLRGGLAFPGANGLDRNLTIPDKFNLGPRFGFAYKASQRMVFRGGYGVLFIPTHPFIGPTTTGFTFNTPMVSTLDGGLTPADTLANPFPQGLISPSGASLGAMTGLGTAVAGQLRDVRRGYSQQWNTTLQYEPWNNWLLEAAWVANKGTRLQGASRQLNVLSDQDRDFYGTRLAESVPNPFRGLITAGPLSGPTITRMQSLLPYPHFTGVNGGYSYLHNSIYHALAVKVEKRLSSGVSLLLAYTKSKMIDDGNATGQIRPGGTVVAGAQNWLNLRAERAKSAQDVPQRLVMTVLWALPFGADGGAFKRHVLGGWHINPITTIESGTPISLTANVVGGANRPNVVPGQNAKVDNPTLERWFNTAAFSVPAPYTLGNVSRTLPNIHSDSVFNVDVSVFKDFPINERIRAQFRAEAFNITNTPTFGTPGTGVASTTFGVVTATAFTPKPREMQLALKIIF